MKIALLFRLSLAALPFAPASGSDHARGVQLMQEGKFAEAVGAFRAATQARPGDAELHYNLALALWRAGEPHDAEIAAEKAATLSDGRLGALRDGILGNLKIDEAKSKLSGEQPDLAGALDAARRARDHFVHGAASPGAPAELVRNLERALELIADIEKKIEEQEKQQDPNQDKDDKDSDQKKDDQKKDDQKKDDQKKDQQDQGDKGEPKDRDNQDGKQEQGKDGKDGDKKEEQPKDQPEKDQQVPPPAKGENKDKPQPQPKAEPGKDEKQPPENPENKDAKDAPPPEPQAGEPSKPPEPKPTPGEGDPDQQPGDKPQAMLGQPQPGKELSPEETKRLLDRLQAILAQKAAMEKEQALARPKVKKDW